MTDTTVLVVDDDRANLDSVSRIFQHASIATLAASSDDNCGAKRSDKARVAAATLCSRPI